MTRPLAALSLQELDQATAATLRRLWAETKGSQPPRNFTARLMRLALAWEAQAALAGGEAASTRRAWKRAMRGRVGNSDEHATSPTVCTGTRLLKIWRGTPHEVLITENGGAIWNGEKYTSLSAVARAMTGTNRNGPKFFGLREDVKR
ncbi:DUF2924 domain-containing protein [Sulfitobacter sp. JBTF-M27]|uniref:DUF2924 domain-containing protein n=1 Tax=Sulfitobacter sediminilitoris TaxID=2698830 RepID=A0A6P0C7Q5_9RHOB|nr:DUF2924 domain-containing protein [Sulfitobacter sediminilitoris]NEK21857.1 DUF2924 domain-containing protein [Sulfitobacter sediminilitoris]